MQIFSQIQEIHKWWQIEAKDAIDSIYGTEKKDYKHSRPLIGEVKFKLQPTRGVYRR
jgi:hypothetical protein